MSKFLLNFFKTIYFKIETYKSKSAYINKILIQLLFIFLLSYFPLQAQYFLITSLNNFNPQKNELSFVCFDSSYKNMDFSESSLKMSIDGANVSIDSVLYFNSKSNNEVSIFIAIEYSEAINDTDIKFINQLLDFYSQYEFLLNCELTVALFSNYPIIIKNPNQNDRTLIQDIHRLKIYPKPNIDNCFNSSYFQHFITDAKYPKQFLIISKSQFDYNSSNIITVLKNNQIKFSNIILPNGITSSFSDIVNSIGGHIYGIDSNLDKIKNISFYNFFNENYYKIFYHYNFCPGEHSINLSADSLSDSLNFITTPNEVADISPKCNYINFGKVDTGRTVIKEMTFIIKNAEFYIKGIECSNPNFQILQDYNDKIIKKDSILKIPIQYRCKDTLFNQSEITIQGKNCQVYKFFAFAGEKPKNYNIPAHFVSPNQNDTNHNDILFSNEIYYLKWTGPYFDDSLWLEYRLKGDSQWHTISKIASNNCYAFAVPDFNDTLIQFRISISKPTWISEKVVQLVGHKSNITDICWSPDNSELISSSEDGKIYLWNTSTGKLIKALFQSQLNVISGIDLSNDGKYIAIAANDSIVKICNKDNEILYKELHCSELINKVKFSNDGKKAIGVSNVGNIFLWDINSGSLLCSNYSQSPVINVLAINPTRNVFATVSKDGSIILWNSLNGNFIKTLYSSNYEIYDFKWSPSGTFFLFTGNDTKLKIFDIDQNKIIQTIFEKEKPIRAGEWSATYPYIMTSNGSSIDLWNIDDAAYQKQYDQHLSNVYRINSSHSSSKIASVDNSHTIQIWSIDDFPFEKPQIIFDSSSFVRVVNKKFITPDLTLPLCQVGDTIYLFYDNYVQNLTNKIDNNPFSIFLQIDSIFQPTHNPSYNIQSRQFPFFMDYNNDAPIALTFTPQTNYDFATTISTTSALKTINSNVQVSILGECINKKAYFIDFGNVQLGNYKDTLFYLFQNISSQNISLDSIRFFYDSSFSIISPTIPVKINRMGGVFVPNFRFRPNKIGYCSALAIFYFNNSIKLTCNFSGYSIGPKLQAPSEFYFDTLICDESEIKSIPLYNSGNSILNIKNITIENDSENNFKLLTNKTFEILPNETKNIDIEFKSNKPGNFAALIKISTNLQFSLDSITYINLFSTKETILLDTLTNSIFYNPLNDSDRIQKIINIKNIGSIQSNFQIIKEPTWFEIDSVIYAYPISSIYCTFIGGANQSEYLDSILIKDECDKIYKIDLQALINSKIAILKIADSIDLGIIMCPGQVDKNIQIENLGDTTLLLTNFSFLKTSNFSIKSNLPINIPPNQNYDIIVAFESTADGNYNDTLVIESNAHNSDKGIIKIPIQVEVNSIKYEISNEVFDFDTLLINQKDTLIFYIKNYSSFPINLAMISSNPNYVLSNTSPMIPEKDSLQISIIYNGNTKAGGDAGKIIIRDTCGNEIEILTNTYIIPEKDIYSISLLKPNPTNDISHIEIISNKSIFYEIKIYNLQGKLVNEYPRVDNFTGSVSIPLNTQEIAIGVYIVEITTSKERTIRKLIKLK